MRAHERADLKKLDPASRRRRAWRISVALVACFLVAAAGLHTILQDSGWWFAVAGIVVVVLVSAAIARAVSARRWLPTLVAFLALTVVITYFFARAAAFLFVVPTLETFGEFGVLAHDGGVSIASQSVPADATIGVVFLLCVGLGALAMVADLLAVTWRRPALAALPLAAVLSVPTFVGIQLADVFFIVLTAVCWLVLLRAGDPLAQTSRALGVGALAVAVALVAPLVLPQVDDSQTSGDGFGGYLSSVNPVLALGEELRRGLPRTILMYSTESGDPSYLRLVSLQNFEPETWEPDPPDLDYDNVPSEVESPPGLAAEVPVVDETTWVAVENLGSPWLPVPYPATEVSGLRGNWFWDAEDLTFTSPQQLAKNEEYSVSSLRVQPTPAQLEAASTTASESVNGVDGKYLDLPPDLPAIIGDTAREMTASAPSDYAKAVALQDYFRSGKFAYSETAPVDNDYDSNGMTAIAQFLEAKSGYCIHFASAMAVMARTLDIPSRVTVGFLPGQKQTDRDEDDAQHGKSTYRVTTRNVHAWPELYFEGIGWTRFEPTAGRGIVPSYADQATPGVPVSPNSTPTPTSTTAPTAAPTRSAGPQDRLDEATRPAAETSLLDWLWAGLLVLAIVLLLLAPAVVRVAQRAIRMRRLARGHPAATTLWKELLQSAHDLGVQVSDSATPRDAASVIEQAAQLRENEQAALASVLGLVERQSFAGELPIPVSVRGERDVAEGQAWARRLNSILARLRAASGWRARLRARIAPPTIWTRLGFRND